MLRYFVDPAIFIDIVSRVPHGVRIEVYLGATLGCIRRSKEAQLSVVHRVHCLCLVPPFMYIAQLRPVCWSEAIADVLIGFITELEEEQLLRRYLLSTLADLIVQVFEISSLVVNQIQPEDILGTLYPFERVPEAWADCRVLRLIKIVRVVPEIDDRLLLGCYEDGAVSALLNQRSRVQLSRIRTV